MSTPATETTTEEFPSNQNYNPLEPQIDPQDYGVVMPGGLQGGGDSQYPSPEQGGIDEHQPSIDVAPDSFSTEIPDVFNQDFTSDFNSISSRLVFCPHFKPFLKP